MSSAVHDLQKAIVEGTQSLTQLLRHAKLIASKLGLEDTEKWIDSELNGYPKDFEPPPYRKYWTHSLEVYNGYRGCWQFAGNLAVELESRQSIAEIERFSKGEAVAFPSPKQFPLRDDFGEAAGSGWPQRFTVVGTQFKRIIDEVTNELLRLTTELEKRGILGEKMSFDENEKEKAANMVFNIGTVHGTVGSTTNSQVTVYDYSSINQMLVDHKIPKQDRRELEDIMDELKEAAPEKKPLLLKRGEDWIVKHKDALGAGAEAVGRAIGAVLQHSQKP